MDAFTLIEGHSPVVATAIHDGHHIRKELYPFLNLEEHERIREEDPYTDYLTEVCEARVLVHRSRFEIDLNRSRDKAIYRLPEDAWGLRVWKDTIPESMFQASLDVYDRFYTAMRHFIEEQIRKFGRFIILDLHTYNHRRQNIWDSAPLRENPNINLGTESISHEWMPLVSRLRDAFASFSFRHQLADVRENVKFKGGHFSRWINEHFGSHGFALPIEFKKTFMDEWTGRVNIHAINELRTSLAYVLPVLTESIATER